jgi:glutamate dehydrogenase
VTDVARAYALTRDAFNVLEINTAIDALDAVISGPVQLDLYGRVRQFTVQRMLWFMRHVDFTTGLSDLVKRFADGISKAPLGDVGMDTTLPAGLPPELAKRMSQLALLSAVPDAVLVAEHARLDVGQAMGVITAMSAKLNVDRLRAMALRIAPANTYERLAIQRLNDSIDTTVRKLAVEVASQGADVAVWADTRGDDLARIIRDCAEMTSGAATLAKLSLAVGALAELPRT